MDKQLKVVCFGEALIDKFPTHQKIGGAPLNVALRLRAAGIRTELISAVGKDETGDKIIGYLKENGVGVKNIQTISGLPSGVVNVEVSGNGAATYEIAHPAAWDRIKVTNETKAAVAEADALVFGSLACRDEVSRESLFQLFPEAGYKILDLNLRAPHYNKEILKDLMQQADFIKFNDDELFEVAEILDSPYHSLEQNLQFISQKTNTPDICVTKGRHGAVLRKNGHLFYNSGFKIRVKDTVGAGDSFLASLISKLLKDKDPQPALNYACAVGALVAGREGANPELSQEEIQRLMDPGK